MFDVVLYQPEIPPNTGNIIRLCANTGCRLHLIKPLGFELDNNALRRAGLDYHAHATLQVHPTLASYLAMETPQRLYACSSKATQHYDSLQYAPGSAFLFGPETRGLPKNILAQIPSKQHITIPMQTPSRSLNLANAVAVIIYEAWRQNRFATSTTSAGVS